MSGFGFWHASRPQLIYTDHMTITEMSVWFDLPLLYVDAVAVVGNGAQGKDELAEAEVS
jgi:hypothetical protein